MITITMKKKKTGKKKRVMYELKGKIGVEDPILFTLSFRRKYKGLVIISSTSHV